MADTIPEVEHEVAALAAARRYCGWHVTPVISYDEIVLDGPCGDLLVLPTLRLVEVNEIVEDGVTLDLADLSWSARGLVRKPGGCWWTYKFGGITATITHGFDSAPDWYAAVKSYMDRTELVGVNGSQRETVGPFTFGGVAVDEYCVFSGAEKAILDLYKLEAGP